MREGSHVRKFFWGAVFGLGVVVPTPILLAEVGSSVPLSAEASEVDEKNKAVSSSSNDSMMHQSEATGQEAVSGKAEGEASEAIEATGQEAVSGKAEGEASEAIEATGQEAVSGKAEGEASEAIEATGQEEASEKAGGEASKAIEATGQEEASEKAEGEASKAIKPAGQSSSREILSGATVGGMRGLVIAPLASVLDPRAKVSFGTGYTLLVNYKSKDIFHVPYFSLSAFKMWDFALAVNILQGVGLDLLADTKIKVFERGASTLAVGAKSQYHSGMHEGETASRYSVGIYVVFTHIGDFLGTRAHMTCSLGWPFLRDQKRGSPPRGVSEDLDWNMGLNVALFPQAFKDKLYWVIDFGNSSYTFSEKGIDTKVRGGFNTGLNFVTRIEGRVITTVSVVATDLLDEGQRGIALSVGGSYGL